MNQLRQLSPTFHHDWTCFHVSTKVMKSGKEIEQLIHTVFIATNKYQNLTP